MIVKALLKRKDNGLLYTDKKLKEEAKKISGFDKSDILQYCVENNYAGVVRSNGTISLTTMGSYEEAH